MSGYITEGATAKHPWHRPIDPAYWADGPKATGGTAGTPGTWTPAGAVAPASVATAAGVTASPATPWTTGQYVVCADGAEACWSGSNWVGGRAP